MRFRDMIRARWRPKKGTSARKRRRMQRILDAMAKQWSPRVKEVMAEAELASLLYGRAAVEVTWDDEKQDIALGLARFQ